ncbi:MAG: glycosyltransferase family 4 protein [Zestosphaera sp.]
MRDLSVLHILQTPLDYVGGPSTYVKELSRHLATKGVKVGIVAPTPTRITNEIFVLNDKYGVNLHFVKTVLPGYLIRTPLFYSLESYKVVAKVVQEYDVINVHVEAALLQGFTTLFNDRRVFLTIHGIYPFEDIETLKNDPFNIHRLVHLITVSPQHVISLKKLSVKSAYVIPVSKFLEDILTSHYRVPREKIVVIPNSVDVDMFKPQPLNNALKIVNKMLVFKGYKELTGNEKIVLFIGRFEPRKGLHILMKSLCMLNEKSWSLIIAGSGDVQYIKMCLNLAEKCGVLNRVFYIGRVPRFLLKYLYSLAYVYVLPSVFEGLPATVLEAMACGSTVIATRVSGIPEVVRHGVTGLLIKKPDPEELARTLEFLLVDEDLRKRLSVNGLDHVRKHFSWQVNAEKYLQLMDGGINEDP